MKPLPAPPIVNLLVLVLVLAGAPLAAEPGTPATAPAPAPATVPPAEDIEFTTDFFAGTWQIAFLYGPAAVDGTWILNADGTGHLSEHVEKRQLGSSDPRDHPLRNRVGKKYEIETDAQWGVSGKYLVVKRYQTSVRGLDKIHHALTPLQLTPDQCTFKDKGDPKSRLVMTRVKEPATPAPSGSP